MKQGFTDAELRAAYETCVLIKYHSDNVLATDDSEADQKWSRDATKFINAYERVNASRVAKKAIKEGKAGHLGNALKILEGMQHTIKDASKI